MQATASEPFSERGPKLSIIFGEIFSRVHGKFEYRNAVMERYIQHDHINYYIIHYNYILLL